VLSPEKTAITHIAEGFTFLGYKFLAKKGQTGTQPRVKLTIPYESVNAKIELIRDLCRGQSQPEVDVIRRINSILWGWMNYYRCATAPSRTFSYCCRGCGVCMVRTFHGNMAVILGPRLNAG